MRTEGEEIDQLRASADAGCVESALKLADIYKRGEGVEENAEEARKWLRVAITMNPGAVVEWYFQQDAAKPSKPEEG
jgi:TPR repeat protein